MVFVVGFVLGCLSLTFFVIGLGFIVDPGYAVFEHTMMGVCAIAIGAAIAGFVAWCVFASRRS